MKTFKEFLAEHVLSIGINPDHEQHREKYRSQIHDILQKSYSHPDIGGYGGHASGSKEESDSIHHDISHSLIKATVRDGKVTTVNLYKDSHGRKSIASGTDGSHQGKSDYTRNKKEDLGQKRAWGEVSGRAEHIMRKLGAPVVPSKHSSHLTGKETKQVDDERYSRKIGGHEHIKTIVGFPKLDK